MATSQNGWSANDRSKIATFTIPGTSRRVPLRKGDCSVVLLDFLAWFDKNIESIDGGQLDDWGYAERSVRGRSRTLSNHASGTGVDVNALRHVMGRRNTFTRNQVARMRAKLRTYDGVIRWGGDYRSRPDEMHFEINAGAAAVRQQANRIRLSAGRPTAPPAAKPATHHGYPLLGLGRANNEAAVRDVQRVLVKLGNRGLAVDGNYGKETAHIVAVFKRNRGINETGVGMRTWAALRKIAHG